MTNEAGLERRHDQIALGRGEKPAPTPLTAAKAGSSGLLTEAQGIPVGLAVDGANRHDMKLVRATVDSLPVPRPAPSPDQPQGMCIKATTLTRCDRVHRSHPQPGRGGQGQRSWVQSQALGGGTLAQLAEPLPAHPWSAGISLPTTTSHFACALTALRAAGLLG